MSLYQRNRRDDHRDGGRDECEATCYCELAADFVKGLETKQAF